MEEIPNIIISDPFIPNTNPVNVPPWVGKPAWSFGPTVPVTVDIGSPVVNVPGCVEAHELNNQKNKNLTEDDPDKTIVYCDAGVPAFETIDYREDELVFEQETVVPKVAPPPEIDTPEIKPPEIPPIEKEIECPAPNQPRVGDLTQNGEERVIGHEIQGTTCVVLYEDTTVVEKYLPSTNQVSVTASIAVVATASAAATPLLLRIVKPVVKQIIKKVQKALGKEPPKLSANEIQTNNYRAKKGLPPYKRPLNHNKKN
tara:strand:- start:87 stop:857 length:771 start_codon:yes stop_codon:yes gene_type:complete